MIEGLWTLDDAVALIPMPSKKALEGFLWKHKEIPRRYRRGGGRNMARCGYVNRMLTDSEIKLIRDMTVNDSWAYRFAGAGRPPGRGTQNAKRENLIAWITQAANG